MLVLKRNIGDKVYIGSDVVVQVVGVFGRSVRLGIQAPPETLVLRHELLPDRRREEELTP